MVTDGITALLPINVGNPNHTRNLEISGCCLVKRAVQVGLD